MTLKTRRPAMKLILPNDPAIRTMGRIDDTDPEHPVWVYPYTQASFRFTGTSLHMRLINRRHYGDSHIGVYLDGQLSKIPIPEDGTEVTLRLADHLPDIEHEVVIYKRQDGQHYCRIEGFLVGDDAAIAAIPDEPQQRRIEIFGDSVSCGERNEASLYVGKADPEADLSSYSDSWRSYGAIAARALHAQLHDVSQGGIALLDGIGWFCEPNQVGMETMWKSLQYNPELGGTTPWDFSRYTPHVVVVAIGQNDAHPVDFMAEDYEGDLAHHWRSRYVDFLKSLRSVYPQAHIVCATTVLQHDPAWDRAIEEAVQTTGDDHISHLVYSRNGSATPGHPRIAEHEEMAAELVNHIESLGSSIWQTR